MKKMPFLFPPSACLPLAGPSLSSFLPLFTQVLAYHPVSARLEGDERHWLGNLFCILCASCPNYCVGKRLSCFI